MYLAYISTFICHTSSTNDFNKTFHSGSQHVYLSQFKYLHESKRKLYVNNQIWVATFLSCLEKTLQTAMVRHSLRLYSTSGLEAEGLKPSLKECVILQVP